MEGKADKKGGAKTPDHEVITFYVLKFTGASDKILRLVSIKLSRRRSTVKVS